MSAGEDGCEAVEVWMVSEFSDGMLADGGYVSEWWASVAAVVRFDGVGNVAVWV